MATPGEQCDDPMFPWTGELTVEALDDPVGQAARAMPRNGDAAHVG